jgi:uncharacterized damage-inducible protein DinB
MKGLQIFILIPPKALYNPPMETKKGRPRQYGFAAPEGFKNPEMGTAYAVLTELSARVEDQIVDLPREVLDFSPGETKLSIGRLALHMGWAEALWLTRASGVPIPADLEKAYGPGALENFSAPPPPSPPAAEIAGLYRRLRDEYSLPVLRAADDPGAGFVTKGLPANLRGILAHLTWHWTYHSGQIGLLAMLRGYDYTWTMGEKLVL